MRRIFSLMFWLLELPLVALGALLVVAWFWSGSDASLASSLRQASRYLPAGQTLVAEDVRGSLRQGGHIGLLRWQKDGLTVQARQIELRWQPINLLNRRLQLDSLHVAELTVDDKNPSSSAAPLEELVLPFDVDLAFAVDLLRWAGPPALEARGLAGTYTFDRKMHALKLAQAQVADGRYQAQATLLARAPMTLDLQVQGKVQAPTGGGRSIVLDAAGALRGPLAGTDVQLDLSAQIQPEKGSAAGAMRAALAAKVSPWAAQPLLRGKADFAELDLAALWPGAPRTALTGSAQVQPQARAEAWQAQLNVANRAAGPWDTGRLPVDKATASVDYVAGRWSVRALDAQAAGGQVQAQGQLGEVASVGALSGWQGQARLSGVNPALAHSQLAPARLDGSLRATAARDAIEFEAALQPAGAQPAASPLQGLRLQKAVAKGRWSGGWLQLQSLDLQTDDARLQGQLDLQPSSWSARGKLQLAAPGADASAAGQLAPQAGAGDLSVQVADAARLGRWSARLPGAPKALVALALQGRGDATLRWQGGWQQWQDGSGAAPAWQLRAQLPQLEWRNAGAPEAEALRVRDTLAELSGSLRALQLKATGAVLRGTLRADIQSDASGGRTPDGNWQASVQALRVQLRDSSRPGPWTAQLRQPLALAWQAASSGGTLTANAGEAELAGPLPGAATVAWQPVRWSTGQRNELVTKGQVRGLELAWLDMLAQAQLANLGLTGNMVFDGDWDVAVADSFTLAASLARRSGDIRVQTDSLPGAGLAGAPASPTVDAGVKEARVTVSAQGDQLRLAALWDSARAGNAQAVLTTRVSRTAEGWVWAADAPLGGAVKASLPQVGAWSVLAPPGWRMRGTLEANLALSGTRAAPQWSGSLQAEDLGLRSVVDGIEFANGRLRASVQGQRLDIAEFTLQGAGGASGGELTARGYALWTPDGTGANPALAKLRMELDATARALRVSARADRRLAVSGNLQAHLENARLQIRGALKADQALFVLPDETAPSLGDDVVVRGTAPAVAQAAVKTPEPRATGAGATPPLPAAGRVLTDVQVTLDLGPDFRVQGRGIATRLAGALQLRTTADANAAPRLTGEVRTVQGTYKAYGQQLDIEQGVMRFLGPYDNPALDILAIRPHLTQRVGVQITGTVLAPRVRLYSEPELAEAEKLAWLVLGRSGANGGAEAAVLQQAALALLGRNGQGGIASRLGLDELSFAAATTNADGTAGSATVTLGKRLSRNFYVAYERSVAGTLGTFSIFYDLSRRFTLRARTGEQSAIDLIFTHSYD